MSTHAWLRPAIATTLRFGAAGIACLALGIEAKASPPSIVVTYNVEYSGLVSLDVGRATVQYGVAGAGYQLTMTFRPSASARSLAIGPAMARTIGAISPAGLTPQAATLDYSVRSLAETRHFTFAGAHLQEVHITKKKAGGLFKDARIVAYDPRTLPAYAPLSDAEQKGVTDPLTAMLLPLAGAGPLDKANCERKLRLYDGRRRFDLILAYQGVEPTTLGGGRALVCGATYLPIAGHSLDGDDFTESMREYRVSVALVQAPSLAFLVPSRITLVDASGATVAEAKAIAIAGR